MVSPKALAEFKEIWKDVYGTEINDETAIIKATALLVLFDVIYQPIPEIWVEEFKNGKCNISLKDLEDTHE